MKKTNKFVSISSSVLLVGALITASSSPVFAGYGGSPAGSSATPCNNTAPGKPSFSFVRKSGTTQIEIGWNTVNLASSWTVAYGSQPGKYIWGMSDFGDSSSRSVKINMLPPGVYYVVVKANDGCMPGPFSNERKITVFNNGNVLGARTIFTGGRVLGARITPTVTPTVTNVPTPREINVDLTPTPTEHLNYFQRLWQAILGR